MHLYVLLVGAVIVNVSVFVLTVSVIEIIIVYWPPVLAPEKLNPVIEVVPVIADDTVAVDVPIT